MATFDSPPKSKIAQWSTWSMIAVVAILAGVLLPQMMQGEVLPEKARVRVEAKDKSGLTYTAPTLPDVPNPQAMFARLALGTIFVLGLCVVSLWGMRRWMVTPRGGDGLLREMKLKETLQLGNRCEMHLVQLGRQSVLVGTDSGGIKTIVPLTGAFEDLLADAEMAPAAPMDAPARNAAA